MNLPEELSSLVKGLTFDKEALNRYSHDASIFQLTPQVVVFPQDSSEVGKLVNFVSKNKDSYPSLSLTARSGGTDMSGGAINDSITIDFTKYFNHLRGFEDRLVTTEPGVYYRDFEREALKYNLFLPSYPASKGICALGGMIANNSGGEKTLTHGKTIDYVKQLKAVLSDGYEYSFQPISRNELEAKMGQGDFEGGIYRSVYKLIESNYEAIKAAKPKVSKNSTAYNLWDVWDKEKFDLTKLLVGSQGTLGLITEAKIDLLRTKEFSGLLVIYLEELEKLPELIGAVSPTQPESFEAFDDHTLRLALKLIPKFAGVLGLKGTIDMGVHFLPQLLSFATLGIPKFTLLVEYTGETQSEVDEKLSKLKEQISHFNIKTTVADTKKKSEKYWVIRRESFNLLRENIKNKHTAPFIDDFIVNPGHLLEFFPKLTDILDKHKLLYTIAGHMGDGNFHIIPLMDLRQDEDKAKIPVVAEEVYDLVLRFGGSISAEHNDGLIRGPYLKKMYGETMFAIFKEVKTIFDPKNIFNPHKKTDANLNYALAHIRDKF